jgi:membrane protease YdiL (CAAX protease family)
VADRSDVAVNTGLFSTAAVTVAGVLDVADWVLVALGVLVIAWGLMGMRGRSARWGSERLGQAGIAGTANAFGAGIRIESVLLPFLVWMLAAAVFSDVIGRFVAEDGQISAMIVAGNLSQILGAVACLWIAHRGFEGGVGGFLIGDGRWQPLVLRGVTYLLASFALCGATIWLTLWALNAYVPDYHFFEHEVINAFRDRTLPLGLVWFGTVLVAPFAEECFFRGILLTALSHFLGKRWLAVFVSAAVFGVIHAGGADSPQPHVVPTLIVLGGVLGVLYVRTGSLLAPIVLHALFNAKTLLWETLVMLAGS